MVVDDYVAGGAFKVGERLAMGLIETHQVLFACDGSAVSMGSREPLARAGVQIVRLFAHAGEPRRAICDTQSAKALIERAKPDKILFVDSSPHSSIAAKDVAHNFATPYVSMINFVDTETPPVMKRWDADVVRAANAANANVVVSAAAKRDFEANFPDVISPCLVVPNGVPDEFFRPVNEDARRALRRELAIKEHQVMLLLAGRLERRKGQNIALAALACLVARADGPELRLVLAGHGDDDERRLLAAEIRRLDLEGHVHYLGPRSDLPQLFDACDLVLMPSQQEADPLVSKEAMAKGRPVVASDLPGVREQGHDAALLVPAPNGASQGTVQGMVAAIDDLRRDATKRAEIGRRLREIAEERFTMAQMIEAYTRILAVLPPAKHLESRSRGSAAPPLGRWLMLSDPRQSTLLKDGWSEVEADGIWSLGPRSRIALSLDHPATTVAITLRLEALVTRRLGRTFEILANGRKIDAWTFTRRRPVEKTIWVSLPSPRRHFIIRLQDRLPRSPFELGLGEDRRKLGLHVRALRVDLAQAALNDGAVGFETRPDSLMRLLRDHSVRLAKNLSTLRGR